MKRIERHHLKDNELADHDGQHGHAVENRGSQLLYGAVGRRWRSSLVALGFNA